MRLSPTAVLKYETCPQQYYLDEVVRVRPRHKAANLVFGSVVHQVIETWLRGWLHGPAPDAGALFDTAWQTARDAGGIDYSTTQSPEGLTATGRALATGFATAWPGFGLLPALDGAGEPVLERKLELQITPGLVFVGKPDLVVLDGDGALGCLDLKTPSSPTDPAWLTGADQLTGYQLLLDAHAERLTLPPVARLGLVELVKRKVATKNGKGPEVCPPVTVARRRAEALAAYTQKVEWVAEDIDRGRFPKRSLMAHNSPCGRCAFRGLCQDGDPEGLVLPAEGAAGAGSQGARQAALAALLAAGETDAVTGLDIGARAGACLTALAAGHPEARTVLAEWPGGSSAGAAPPASK